MYAGAHLLRVRSPLATYVPPPPTPAMCAGAHAAAPLCGLCACIIKLSVCADTHSYRHIHTDTYVKQTKKEMNDEEINTTREQQPLFFLSVNVHRHYMSRFMLGLGMSE